MKYKVSELEGALLDAAVAMTEDLTFEIRKPTYRGVCFVGERKEVCHVFGLKIPGALPFMPSSDWSDGGPLIERERISIVAFTGYNGEEPLRWWAQVGDFGHFIDEGLPGYQDDRCGETPLIAAMRAFVSSKLGKEVELP